MIFEPRCLSRIFEKAERNEAKNDYASLTNALGYSSDIAEIYANLKRPGDPIPTELDDGELSKAVITEGHGCEYICGKYSVSDLCEKCEMKDRADACYIRGDANNLTQNNIIDLKKLREENKSYCEYVTGEDEGIDIEPVAMDIVREAAADDAKPEQEAAPEPLSAEENEAAAERERRLLIFIMGQTPARVRTVLPRDKEAMECIKARFISKMAMAGSDRVIYELPLNAILYDLLYGCIIKKMVNKEETFIDVILPQHIISVLRYDMESIPADKIKVPLVGYYEELREEALVFAKEYAKKTDAGKRKVREEICTYFKGGIVKKQSGASRKEI